MNPTTAEKTLIWLLRLDGLIMSLALVAVFFPDVLMQWLHSRLGLGEMPVSPITEYLARSCSALYAMHGAVLLFVSLRVRDYWGLVRWILLLHIFLGLSLLGIDLAAAMPWYWTAVEGLPIAALGTFMLWLWKRADRAGVTGDQGT